MQRLLADVQRDVTELVRLSKISVDTTRLSVQIRKSLVELGEVLSELDEGLEKARRSASMCVDRPDRPCCAAAPRPS